jgi:hypothetical protein
MKVLALSGNARRIDQFDAAACQARLALTQENAS